jgi:hypothetical protein
LPIVAQGVLGFVSLSGATAKSLDPPAELFAAIGTLRWFEPRSVPQVVSALVTLEFALAAWLLCGALARIAVFASLISLVALTAILWQLGAALGWGRPCGCGVGLSGETISVSLVRNALLIALNVLLVAALFSRGRRLRGNSSIAARSAASAPS